MKVPGQEENAEGCEPGMNDTSGNGSGIATASESQSTAMERSGSGEPGASEGSQSLPARRATGPRTHEGKQRSRLNSLKHAVFSASALVKGESQSEYDSLLDDLTKAITPVGKLEEVLVEILTTIIWRRRRLIQAEGAEIQRSIDLMDWQHQIRNGEGTRSIDFLSLIESKPGLFWKTDNPFALKRCLHLLAELRDRIAENGFTEGDIEILRQLYGDADQSNLSDNLHNEYLNWSKTASASEAGRLKEGHATPEQCKHYVLVAINREVRRLKEYLKVEVVRRVVPESSVLDRLLRYDVSLDRSFSRAVGELERLQRMRLGQPVAPRIDLNISRS